MNTNTVLLKKYRNKLIGILKISRQSLNQNYFNENNKIQEPRGKVSVKLYILKLKTLTKQIAHPLF